MHRQSIRRVVWPSWQAQTRTAFHHRQRFLRSSSTSSSSSSSHAVFQNYRKQVDEGKITYDPIQVRAVRHFDLLYEQLQQYGGPTNASSSTPPPSSSSWWQRLTGPDSNAEKKSAQSGGAPKGLYIHGGVGCGKVRLFPLPK